MLESANCVWYGESVSKRFSIFRFCIKRIDTG